METGESVYFFRGLFHQRHMVVVCSVVQRPSIVIGDCQSCICLLMSERSHVPNSPSNHFLNRFHHHRYHCSKACVALQCWVPLRKPSGVGSVLTRQMLDQEPESTRTADGGDGGATDGLPIDLAHRHVCTLGKRTDGAPCAGINQNASTCGCYAVLDGATRPTSNGLAND